MCSLKPRNATWNFAGFQHCSLDGGTAWQALPSALWQPQSCALELLAQSSAKAATWACLAQSRVTGVILRMRDSCLASSVPWHSSNPVVLITRTEGVCNLPTHHTWGERQELCLCVGSQAHQRVLPQIWCLFVTWVFFSPLLKMLHL